jgi:Ca-activated chloride channel family protein
MKKLLLLLMVFMSAAQAKEITGTVTDPSGEPIFGATIQIKGTKKMTTTNFDGKYKINAKQEDSLVYAYTGYDTQEVYVGKQIKIDVQLTTSLDEVVIVGYKKTNFLGRLFGRRSETAPESTLNDAIVNQTTSTILHQASSNPNDSEEYAEISENTFKNTSSTPLSTFSIDVDKASYSNIRRMINNGEQIPTDAVKIEEMINYFSYDYQAPKGTEPISIYSQVIDCPWNKKTKLARIALRGRDLPKSELPPSNLTFLIDVSGSMNYGNKLPLVKKTLELLVQEMRPQDRVSIAVYAGSAGVVLEPTAGNRKQDILEAINNLQAGGSTAGAAGIELSYELAEKHFVKKGNNRVIIATDGDFNVGLSSIKELEDLIASKRETGVFLSVLGYGMGNYHDSTLETLADKGNGNHAYIDSMQEAQKVFQQEFNGTLHTIAKDVKLQIEFNPATVAGYRLIGYENRLLNDEDFVDDKKDAGELGLGHAVTALYEIVPAGVEIPEMLDTIPLKYSSKEQTSSADDFYTVKLRFKEPDGDKSKLLSIVQKNKTQSADADFKFITAVAMFGMKLRDSKFAGNIQTSDITKLADQGRGKDENGYRAEFIRLVRLYETSKSAIASGQD